MSYLFLYKHSNDSKWGPLDSINYFNFSMLDTITVNYEYHHISYYKKSEHYLHAIANIALDYELQSCGILQVDDDFKALELRMRHDEFLVDADKVKLYDVYENPNFEEILDGCPILKTYADRGATKSGDTKYVTKVANAVAEVARNVRLLNGALGDDFETQFGDLAYLCNTRISEYKETNRKNAAALVKERKVMRRRLLAFRAKEL